MAPHICRALLSLCAHLCLDIYTVGVSLSFCVVAVVLRTSDVSVSSAVRTFFLWLSVVASLPIIQAVEGGNAGTTTPSSESVSSAGQPADTSLQGHPDTDHEQEAADRSAATGNGTHPAETEGVAHKFPFLRAARQSEAEARVIEQVQLEGVEHNAHTYSIVMSACVKRNVVDMALKVLNQILDRGVDYNYDVIPEKTRREFFTFVAGHVDDKFLRKAGLKTLEAVTAHGITPPHILQNRLICVWGSEIPEKLLDHFAMLREDGVMLSSTAQRCIAHVGPPADMVPSPPMTVHRCAAQSERQKTPTAPHRTRPPSPLPPEEPERTPEDSTVATPTRLSRHASPFVPTLPSRPSAQADWCSGSLDEPSTHAGRCGGQRGSLDEPGNRDGWHGGSDLALLQMDVQMQPTDCTTVMLRNLPGTLLRDGLIHEVDRQGFAGLYNFVYVPVDVRSHMGLGYAFVNLLTEELMWRFAGTFNGFSDWPMKSSKSLKVCAVELSQTQGLAAHVKRLRNSPVMGGDVPDMFQPALFDKGERVPFPKPTWTFRASAARADGGGRWQVATWGAEGAWHEPAGAVQ